jgi:hypothetical protein
MDAKDHGEQTASKTNICSLEWLAWAIDAARRHKDDEQAETRVQHVPDYRQPLVR